ncbi:hypothetical protein OGAPHI_000209 [Ogataea philodendri]|uniref:Uncharacterized protein n=1 Tax=Ogataea philodendri TaxID=1378263 RepID=A0A9P8TA46_9ASCO|nr:uncharacterized protein OGAPHI_000209 [Ogataea philodendri]KAH3671506.1 hypothetical protein OGAPHI_000209 [Ogataea philodendri]
MRFSVALLTILAAVQSAPVPVLITRMHTAQAVTTTEENYYTVTSTIPIVEVLISNGVSYTKTLLTTASGSDIDTIQPTTTLVVQGDSVSTSGADAETSQTQTSSPEPTTTSTSSTSTSLSQGTTESSSVTSAEQTSSAATVSTEDFNLVNSVDVENLSTGETGSSTSATSTSASSVTTTSATSESSTKASTESSTEASSESSSEASTESSSTSSSTSTTSSSSTSSTTSSSSTSSSSTSSTTSSKSTSSTEASSTSSTSTTASSSTSSSSAVSTIIPSAIVYSPYTDSGSCKDYDSVKSDLALIQSKGINEVRIYGNDCNYLTTVLPICADKGIKVDQCFYIQSDGVDSIDDAVSDLIDAVQDSSSGFDWDLFSYFVVGNEAINNGYCTVDDLISKISSVKSKLKSAGYTGKVTTAEPPVSYERHSSLCTDSEIDFVGINPHAYFDSSSSAEDAGNFVSGQISLIEGICTDQEVLVLETGYPSEGIQNGGNIPSKENQRIAIKGILEQAGSKTTILSTYNDYWKEPGPYGIEQSFGVIDILE